jgi:hypothetical protein
VPREQRCRPAHADDERRGGEPRPARGSGEPGGEREGEDRDQEDAVHARVEGRVERHLDVVEVEEPSPEPVEQLAGIAPGERELERTRGGDEEGEDRSCGPASCSGDERRKEREPDDKGRLRGARPLLEA